MEDEQERREIVLVTGGSGFLGQHIVKLLQERDLNVQEIRVLDLKPYVKHLEHKERVAVRSYVGDIVDVASVRSAFCSVDCVIHCAALVSYQFPPDYEALNTVNVTGTQNVVSLCIELCIPRLVFTSTSEVTLSPYFGSIYSLIVNQTERKAAPPVDGAGKGLLVPGYPASKLRAERIVLSANGTPFSNGNGQLHTVALRPTLLYGEEDPHLIPSLIGLSDKMHGTLPRFAGSGGRQQITYVGNAAWAHILAKKELLTIKPGGGIVGLPIFVTDDTPVDDLLRFIEKVSSPRCRQSCWYVPSLIAYFVAALLETFAKVTGTSLPISPCGLVSYLGSIVLYNRLRAALHLDYSPIYQLEECYKRSKKFYSRQNMQS